MSIAGLSACSSNKNQSLLCDYAKSFPANSDYASLVCQGENQLVLGQIDKAEATFSAALEQPFHEIQNYFPIIRLAEIKCLKKEWQAGHALLNDFACMLSVEAGIQQCYANSESLFLGSKNINLSKSCFQHMCGEMYLPYYEDPSAEMLHLVGLFQEEVSRVADLCSE